jgi:pimeloyl-ACP methyl ester carboxylesterase
MPYVTTDDGIELYYEATGAGTPLVFVHEFAGDHRSWEPQVRYFSRLYRCITFAARGYAPSDVPDVLEKYSQSRAVDDIVAIITGLGLQAAHVIGLSMGGYAALHLAIRRPELLQSIVIAGCGYGAEPPRREAFQQQSGAIASLFETAGSPVAAEKYANVAARWPYLRKDPRGWSEFLGQLGEHSAVGSALTLRGVQMRRPSLWECVEEMRRIATPTLIVTGDDDDACLEPALLMKRTIPRSGLLVLPRGGHATNLEEPDAFNRAVGDFLHAVKCARW